MIHHATAALAQKNGLVLSENVEARTVAAFKPENGFRHEGLEGEKAKDVLQDALALLMIRAEYPGLQPQRAPDTGVWGIVLDDQQFDGDRLQTVLDEALDYAQENEIDLDDLESEEQDEEEEPTSSIVPPKYRIAYKERGNAAHCGDWMAQLLDGICKNEDDTLNKELYSGILDANGVDWSGEKLQRAYHTNPGRFRMSTGGTLRKVIAVSGVLIVPATGDADDTEYEVPQAFRDKHAPKPKEAGSKKRAKKAA